MCELQVGGKYYLTKKLGKSDCIGNMYSGYNERTKEEVAVKIEKISTSLPRMLQFEAKVCSILQKEEGFPRVHWFG